MLYTEEAIKQRRLKVDKIKRIIRNITYILVIPILIYNITLIIQAVAKPNKTPSFLGLKTYVIISGSMIPEFEVGDIVVVKVVNNNSLNVGDIISFREGQNVITHRIIEVIQENGKTTFKTKGDNNNSEDTRTVSGALIEGKVIKKIRFIGKIALLLQGKIAIIIIIVIYYIIVSRERKNKQKKERRKNKRLLYEENKKVSNKKEK